MKMIITLGMSKGHATLWASQQCSDKNCNSSSGHLRLASKIIQSTDTLILTEIALASMDSFYFNLKCTCSCCWCLFLLLLLLFLHFQIKLIRQLMWLFAILSYYMSYYISVEIIFFVGHCWLPEKDITFSLIHLLCTVCTLSWNDNCFLTWNEWLHNHIGMSVDNFAMMTNQFIPCSYAKS